MRRLRAEGHAVPIFLLTAPHLQAGDRAALLDAGADECLSRPFAFIELAARLNALARLVQKALSGAVPNATLSVHDIEMDLLRREVRRDGRPIRLQPGEFRLLEQLLRHPDRIVTRTMLLDRVWSFAFDPRTNVVETQVSRLRAKLNRGFKQDAILTVRGAGYMIRSLPT
jgi:two-component system OmpR family response regulator